jgi:hypothetical protein
LVKGLGGGITWREMGEAFVEGFDEGTRDLITLIVAALWGLGGGISREPKWNSGSSPKVKTSGDPEFRLYEPLESQVSAPLRPVDR